MSISVDIKLRILWLSDIHYLKEYKKKTEDFQKYIDTFLATSKSSNKELEIDFVLISGDIAQSGTDEEYKLFKADILDPLFMVLPKARLLIIPGNHDVARRNIVYFDKYFPASNEQMINPSEFLREHKRDFNHIFRNYRSAFKNHPKLPPNGLSPNYAANLYHGFYKDEDKKTIFVFLNSAWMSSGEDALKYYLKNHLKRKVDEKGEKQEGGKSDDVIAREITRLTHEYGHQIIGMSTFLDFPELKEQLEDYSEYLVVTVVHHPNNWLIDVEQVNYEGDPESPLFFLREKTSLLLTGHEHVPYHHLPEFQNDKRRIHIPAGSFIQAVRDTAKPGAMTYSFDQTMFSILDINVKKRRIVNSKYIYQEENWKFIKEDDVLLAQAQDRVLTEGRQKILLNKIDTSIEDRSIISKLYRVKKIDKHKIYFVDKVGDLYAYVGREINFDIDALKAVIKSENSTVINFIFIDVKFDNGKMYRTEKDGFLVLNSIKKSMEIEFNKFRHRFFSSLKGADILDFKDIRFVLSVKPYYEIEFLL